MDSFTAAVALPHRQHSDASASAEESIAALAIEGLTLKRGSYPVVQNARLAVPAPGLLFVVGSGGAGKSSLLAGIAGVPVNDLSMSGALTLNGIALTSPSVRKVWLQQHIQLHSEGWILPQLRSVFGISTENAMALLRQAGVSAPTTNESRSAAVLSRSQRRLVAILAALSSDADLYLVDEPTADLVEPDVERVRRRLAELAQRAMVIVATHNRQDCIALGGYTTLLAGGALHECSPTPDFFGAPKSAAAQTYVRTGSCSLRAPVAAAEVGGVWTLIPNVLYGMSRPGMVEDDECQYNYLRSQGVSQLFCLEERCTYDWEPARRLGLSCYHFAIPDMAPPSFAQMVDICRLAERAIKSNEGVVMHCRGGLGRTGTALAGVLIWFGDDAQTALARVREACPRAVQSRSQELFLIDFADRIAGWH